MASVLLGVSLGREQLLSKSDSVGCPWTDSQEGSRLMGAWGLVTIGVKCTGGARSEGMAALALWPDLADPLLGSKAE